LKKSSIVLILLTILGVITFLDRINITMAGTQIMEDLDLSIEQWGWVLSAFIISYGLLQIPLGALGDKRGQRTVLAVIVLWWSCFTGLTGMAGGFISLLLIRFSFGIGEAGAYPCMTGAIGRWFPKSHTGKAQGYIWAASRVGGALTPFIVIPIITNLGWRAAFYILGAAGLIWVIVWYTWYRDNPAGKKGITRAELNELETVVTKTEKVTIPWSGIVRSRQFWLIIGMYWFYAWASWFFFSWFPTFMEQGRGFEYKELNWAVSVPFLSSMIGNISGGYLSDSLSKKYGLKTGRRIIGVGSLALSAVFMFLAAFIPGKIQVFIFLSLSFGVIDLMLPSAWAVCLDVGRKYGGAISGAMNTAGNIGGFTCATVFGYLVKATGNFNFPLYVISGMLVISAILFTGIDASKPLVQET
jgi:ACS family glucarate transporter-like MFS transporter